jgi:hypothetical protein
LLVGFKTAPEEIFKEKNLQDNKHDKQFDKDNGPKLTANSHLAKALVIKIKDLKQEISHTSYFKKLNLLIINNI